MDSNGHGWRQVLAGFLISLCGLGAASAGGPGVRVQQFGAITDDGASDSAAIEKAIRSLRPGQTLLFPKGVYHLDAVVWIESLRDIRLAGEPGATIKKGCESQYMFAFIAGTDVTVEGLSFEGKTEDPRALVWGEEGLYFGSCTRPTVKGCRFANFGDSAVRMTTSLATGEAGSFDGKILNCRFDNVTQITTTQGMEGNYAGTSGIRIEGNVFENLKGSIKLATRAPCSGGRIIGNQVRSSRRDGIQVESVSDVLIESNTLERIAGTAILLNTNDQVPTDAPGFAWDRVTVRNNVIRGAARGIGVYLKPYPDGSQFDMTGLEITGNRFEGIADPHSDATIWIGTLSQRAFVDLFVEDNAFVNAAQRERVRFPPDARRRNAPP